MTTTFTTVAEANTATANASGCSPTPTQMACASTMIGTAVGACGIAQRAERDAPASVAERTRSYTHAAADLPRLDPFAQHVIGRQSSTALTARATVLAVAVIDVVLPATSLLFEVGGASITFERPRLDRHWRNARTISVHNPAIYKARTIGDHLLNGVALSFAWSAGERNPGMRLPPPMMR